MNSDNESNKGGREDATGFVLVLSDAAMETQAANLIASRTLTEAFSSLQSLQRRLFEAYASMQTLQRKLFEVQPALRARGAA